MTTSYSGSLTFSHIIARPVLLKLKRPLMARIGSISEWPVILIDLHTEEGIIGKSYLEPYLVHSMKYLIAALHDFNALLKGHQISPMEMHNLARKSLHLVGYQGLSTIAVAGLDMAAWDAQGSRNAAVRTAWWQRGAR